jgi:hypothetical protein
MIFRAINFKVDFLLPKNLQESTFMLIFAAEIEKRWKETCL